jgi:hypothetical protein
MFREEWSKKVIAGAVVLSFAILGFFGRKTTAWLRGTFSDIRNVSKQEALNISRNYLGSNVVAAIPFRNVGDKAQYIAALGAFDESNSGMPAFLLVGNGRQYDVIKLDTTVHDVERDDDNLRGLFGVIDCDGTGKKRVYTVDRSGGSGMYGVTVGIYDGAERVLYSVETEGNSYDDVDLPLEFSKSVSDKPAIRKWLEVKAKELVIARPDPYIREVHLWRLTNYPKADFEKSGKDFHEGLVQIHEFPGRIPTADANSIGCQLEDAQFQWISFFKGGVFGYDKQRNVHFAVWIPYDDYDWIQELTSGEQYLWFGHDSKHAIAAYDKKEHYFFDHPTFVSEKESALSPSLAGMFYKKGGGRLIAAKETEFSNPSRCESGD